jgi:Sap, sulfolipid-1-addressing protein
MAAGLTLHATSVKLDEALVLIVIYTVIATSTVVVPIVASLVAPRRVEPKLIATRNWMSHNGRLLTSLIMFMIGIVILGYGLTQL